MKKTLLLITGFLVLLAAEILRVYFIMPFPGSQQANSIQVAYFINKYIWCFRIAGMLLFIPSVFYICRNSKWWKKILAAMLVLLYATVLYFFNFKFLADKMFYQPCNKILATVSVNTVDHKKLIIGININGEAKAYPIELIGYHHQVQDTIGGEPVMVTYCTVCRTGRVFHPFVNGKPAEFRLVGMDHFNAMFEDAATKSWWRQATGKAVAGPLKGDELKEIFSVQMSLATWIRQYPNTLILQPDSAFAKQYRGLQGFDEGTIKSGLEKRDSGSWQFKSWIIGLQKDGYAKAYDWNNVIKQRLINDTFQNMAVVLVVENDDRSFHVWNRQVNEKPLVFYITGNAYALRDSTTNSLWNMDGLCIDGILKGYRLSPVQSYQEFWHSWQYFHPSTFKYIE